MDLPLSVSSHLLCLEDSAAVASWDGRCSAADEWAAPPLFVDEERGSVAAFLAAEPDHMPSPDYLPRFHSGAADASARLLAVDWIIKVNKFYRFRPVTAYLAINYLDRFLSSHSLPKNVKGGDGGGRGWPMQLLSVACVSVAAKMEETHVPLLLDLQILDPRFVFEPRTIQRMELLVMSALHWRMRSVTPFDFLRQLAPVGGAASSSLLSRASDLILQTHLVVDFLGYRPSAIAAAAVCCASCNLADSTSWDIGEFFSGYSDWIDKESASRCHQLMKERLLEGRRVAQAPPSPVGVLDVAAACGSCNSSVRLSSADCDDEDRAESVRPAKRLRVDEVLLQCTESIDY